MCICIIILCGRLIMKSILVTIFLLLGYSANAAVVKEFALNNYGEHVLSRAEKKCIEEGYKITYANCENKTAPADRCPHHDNYWRSCSQEQWCINNNYTFHDKDCELPYYPIKQCDNQFSMYRICKEDTAKACEKLGFVSQATCQLSEIRCQFDNNYGKCCDDCPEYEYLLDELPEGYVSTGELCTTCDKIVKTKIKEADCEGFVDCLYGPASAQTEFCKKGKKVLYASCKSAETLCRENGYVNEVCDVTEDEVPCSEFENLKKCKVNCYKYAVAKFADSDIVGEDIVNPRLNTEKKKLRSLYGKISAECEISNIPTITLDIDSSTFLVYRELFNRDIENVNFELNFLEPVSLQVNGSLKNVKINVKGNVAQCALQGESLQIYDKVSLVGGGNICANITVNEFSKFTTESSIFGNVEVHNHSQLGIKGDLYGLLQTKSYAKVFIKGKIKYGKDVYVNSTTKDIVFGCNSNVRVIEGIDAEIDNNVIVKQYALIDVPFIKVESLGSETGIYVHKFAKITSILGDSVYQLVDNLENKEGCEEKYLSIKTNSLELNMANVHTGKWQCHSLNKNQLRCD